ncbi:MAG: helix-turn-helix domain-containing protein [Chlorobium sp.]|nr:helix-turn-helix domain-containing protein [Chlorobium sp.]
MCLFYLLQSGLSWREIGRRLNRSHTTLSREVKRNKRIFGCY